MNTGIKIPFVKVARAQNKTGLGERWSREETAPTVNLFYLCDNSGCRSVAVVCRFIYRGEARP